MSALYVDSFMQNKSRFIFRTGKKRMIILFYLSVAQAVHTNIWHADFTLQAFNQPETVNIMYYINRQKLLKDDHFQLYFDFVGKGKRLIQLEDIEASFSGLG